MAIMDLFTSLQTIINERSAKKVRQSIHDGIFRANQVVDANKNLVDQVTIRQDAVEQYNDQMITEMTDKDVISAPEIIQARGGKATLGERLDETTTQLTQTMNYLNDLGVNVIKNGAKGDGVADDTLAIQNTIDYVASIGGGTVYFPQTEGFYKITESIKITSSNIKLLSNGATIKCEGVFNGSGSQDLAVINVRNNNKQIENISVRGFELYGPKVGEGIEGYGIHISWAKNVIVSDNNIYECDDSGIRVDGYGALWGDTSHSPRSDEGFTSYISVENNNIYNTLAGCGIELISYPTHCSVSNNKIMGCQFNGLRVAGSYMTTISNNVITDTGEGRALYLAGRVLTATGNVIDNSIQSIGVYLNDLHDSIISNNTIQNSGVDGIYGITTEDINISIKRCIISNNTIKNWGTYGGSVWAIVIRGEGSDDNSIENNIIIAETHGQRGINVQDISNGFPKNNMIRNNRLKVLGTSKLVINGTILTGGSNYAINNIDLDNNRSVLGDTTPSNVFLMSSIPTHGYWNRGDVIIKPNPFLGLNIGWVCVSSGSPGTWESFGQVGIPTGSSTITTTPTLVGQIAIVSGIGYIATGVNAPTDWKQITN